MRWNSTRTARIKLHRGKQRTAVGVAVALVLGQGQGPSTTQRRPPACRPPAGKAHRSYTSLPHITILILLILHTVKSHRLHLCPHITICVLVVVCVLILLNMCRHNTHTAGKSHTLLTDPGASARAAHTKSIHELITNISPLN